MNKIQRALLSVSDKTGIVEFATRLHELDIELLSTGGTAKLLAEAGLPVTEVSSHTGFPEMMAGRIKTLHPKIHGGLLGRRGTDDAVMQEHDIAPIDLVVVNLYPFAETVAKPDCTLTDAIENIDIGGPTMLRAAAKNHADVTVVIDPQDYDRVLTQIRENGATDDSTRFDLALKTFEHTAQYDGAIANYLGTVKQDGERDTFPRTFNSQFQLKQNMRYGENPHQQAAFYTEKVPASGSVSAAKQLQGKALSYNNIADTDAALECVKVFTEQPACVIVKHANPCGVATAKDLVTAYDRAFQTDPTSAFGGIIAFNKELDADTAKAIIERQFVEVIIAPHVSEAARTIISEKRNVRLLQCGDFGADQHGFDFKRVNGGLLVQDRDIQTVTADQLQVVTHKQPDAGQIEDLLFAWRVAKFVKSNAIVYASNQQTVGIGAGQMSRVVSSRIAGIKAADAGLTVPGAVMASDAFFPFRDGLDAAAEAGISAVIQPGGSMRDKEVIAAADEHEIAMVFTGMRHFRH